MPENSKNMFDKPPISLDEQIVKLQDRGLYISDTDTAKHYLQNIGYYRLSGYMLPFQSADQSENHHNFKEQTKFEDILSVYMFDRKLRLLVMDAIERIETSIKALIINEMCVLHGSHWYMNPEHFVTRFITVNERTSKSSYDRLIETI